MQFNQVNQNRGDVNNTVVQNGNATQNVKSSVAQTEKGTVLQTIGNDNVTAGENAVSTHGDGNKVNVAQPKESFWDTAWKKIKGVVLWVRRWFGSPE
jgi:hypothetical protein